MTTPDEMPGEEQQTPFPDGEWGNFFFRNTVDGATNYARVISVSAKAPLLEQRSPAAPGWPGDLVSKLRSTFVKATITVSANNRWEERSRSLT